MRIIYIYNGGKTTKSVVEAGSLKSFTSVKRWFEFFSRGGVEMKFERRKIDDLSTLAPKLNKYSVTSRSAMFVHRLGSMPTPSRLIKPENNSSPWVPPWNDGDGDGKSWKFCREPWKREELLLRRKDWPEGATSDLSR